LPTSRRISIKERSAVQSALSRTGISSAARSLPVSSAWSSSAAEDGEHHDGEEVADLEGIRGGVEPAVQGEFVLGERFVEGVAAGFVEEASPLEFAEDGALVGHGRCEWLEW